MRATEQIELGLTQQFDCAYLPEEQEQLLVVMSADAYQAATYEALLHLGFRRSGSQIYRPKCPNCSACQSMRIRAEDFVASRSQKRVLRKNLALTTTLETEITEAFYPLYERYINTRHRDGGMFPATREQFDSFIPCHWLDVRYLCIYDHDKLVAVAVLDWLANSASAIYTFFAPEYQHHSIGTLAILKSIEFCVSHYKEYLYLGYQIDQCAKMNYKRNYVPNQILDGLIWKTQVK